MFIHCSSPPHIYICVYPFLLHSFEYLTNYFTRMCRTNNQKQLTIEGWCISNVILYLLTPLNRNLCRKNSLTTINIINKKCKQHIVVCIFFLTEYQIFECLKKKKKKDSLICLSQWQLHCAFLLFELFVLFVFPIPHHLCPNQKFLDKRAACLLDTPRSNFEHIFQQTILCIPQAFCILSHCSEHYSDASASRKDNECCNHISKDFLSAIVLSESKDPLVLHIQNSASCCLIGPAPLSCWVLRKQLINREIIY